MTHASYTRPAPASKTPEQAILEGMLAIDPWAATGGPVIIADLREHLGMPKATFDAACLKLRKEVVVSLCEWPYSTVTPEEAQAYVADGKGKHFNVIALRK